MNTRILLMVGLLAGCGQAPDDTTDGVMQPADQAHIDDDTQDVPDEDGTPDDTSDDDAKDPVDMDDPEDPEDPVDEPVDPADVTLDDLFEPLFVASGCTAGYCHGGFGSADAVAALVDTPVAQPVCGRTQFVVPGDPENSILWVRVRDTTDEDIECEVVKMPNGRTEPLDPELTQMLYDWIEQGAKR